MARSDCNCPNTLSPDEFYIQWCGALDWTRWGSYFEKFICPCLEVNFLKKLPQLVALRIFQNSYLRTYITITETKVGSLNFGYQIWFCTLLLKSYCVNDNGTQ